MNPDIGNIVDEVVECFEHGHKVLVFGVGGNAANAIHFSAELQGKFEQFSTPLPCIDLCSNPSVISAIATDFGWEYVFERQIKALAKPGDIVFAFSISTKGPYLKQGIEAAQEMGARVILSCGSSSREGFLDRVIVLEQDSLDTPWVQERQLELVHTICRDVKKRFP